jgi:hypothetical protein
VIEDLRVVTATTNATTTSALPPGLSCVETDADRACLETYLDAIRRAQELDLRLVCQHTTVDFDIRQIVGRPVQKLRSKEIQIGIV